MKNVKQPNKVKFLKAIELLSQGLNQKETSIKIGVSEKTLGVWAKQYETKNGHKAKDYLQNIDLDKENLVLLKERLKATLGKVNAKSSDIKNLVFAIKQLEPKQAPNPVKKGLN